MTYLSESGLRHAANRASTSGVLRKFIQPLSFAKVSVFLSHSHSDKTLVEGFIQLLAEQGIEVYVDWNDTQMPKVTNRETADKIKAKISELDLFILLATKNALNSKWVPWEVGIADKSKPIEKILVVPITDDTGSFQGNEYLQLYNRIEITSTNELGSFKPNQPRGMLLKTTLTDKGYY